ncbi:MAG TPA: hypothetical protein VIH61_00835 [Waddliaceae bacterium]
MSSIQLNVQIQNETFNYDEEVKKVGTILQDRSTSTVTKLEETAKVFFNTAAYAQEQDKNSKIIKEELVIAKKEKETISNELYDTNKKLQETLNDRENIYKDVEYLKKRKVFEKKAQDLIQNTNLHRGVSDIGSSLLSRISSIALVSIIGIPISLLGMAAHHYAIGDTADLESYVWALENFPESCEDDEIMQKAKRIGHRDFLKKMRKELLEGGPKGLILNAPKSGYVDDNCRLVNSKGQWIRMERMHSLSQDEIDEIEEIEQIAINKECQNIKEFVDKKIYKR